MEHPFESFDLLPQSENPFRASTDVKKPTKYRYDGLYEVVLVSYADSKRNLED